MGDYLQHHGILGQKWGVRRYQNLDGSYTAAGRARYGRNSSQDQYKQYEVKNTGRGSDISDVLPSGMKVQNVAPSDKMRPGRMYVSYIKDDMDVYKSLMPEEQRGNRHYSIMYETINPLNVARGKDLVDAYLQLEADKKLKRGKFLIGDDQAATDEFLMEKLNSNKKLSEAYFKILENKGFHAMQDVEDVRYDFAVDPLIIFNAEKVLRRLSVVELPKSKDRPPFNKDAQLRLYKSIINGYKAALEIETDPVKKQYWKDSIEATERRYDSLVEADDLNKWLDEQKINLK